MLRRYLFASPHATEKPVELLGIDALASHQNQDPPILVNQRGGDDALWGPTDFFDEGAAGLSAGEEGYCGVGRAAGDEVPFVAAGWSFLLSGAVIARNVGVGLQVPKQSKDQRAVHGAVSNRSQRRDVLRNVQGVE